MEFVSNFAAEVILVILRQFLNVLKVIWALSDKSPLLENIDLVNQVILFTECCDI